MTADAHPYNGRTVPRDGSDPLERGLREVPEVALPDCVRDVLAAARAARTDTDVTCVAFRTLEDGRETARIEPDIALLQCRDPHCAGALHAKNALVLSVTVTETTFETV